MILFSAAIILFAHKTSQTFILGPLLYSWASQPNLPQMLELLKVVGTSDEKFPWQTC